MTADERKARAAAIRHEERMAARREARRIGKPAATGEQAREQVRRAAARKADGGVS